MIKEKKEALIHAWRHKETLQRPGKIAISIAEEILTALDGYTTRLTVCFPVVGMRIQLEEGKLELGNILFQHMTKERIDEVVDRIVSSGTRYTENEKQAWREYFTKEIQELFNDEEISVCAVYDVVAEPIRAEERARTECYLVFHLLRYSLPLLSSRYPSRYSPPRQSLHTDRE